MSYIDSFEVDLAHKIDGNDNTASIVAWASERVLESYRNGIKAAGRARMSSGAARAAIAVLSAKPNSPWLCTISVTDYIMSLDQKDLELIERIVFKSGDDVAVSIARSFERLEERIDATESRLYSRIAEVEDRIEASRQDVADDLATLRDSLRE